ncbi:MAG TPA: DciA family protein, partial [Opitutales bacterium]|nr:DciA family protein [Opitutales bacterium]
KKIMGEHMAQRASPQSILPGGKLVISVSNPIIREELRFQQRQILQKIEAVLGVGVVRELNFRV